MFEMAGDAFSAGCVGEGGRVIQHECILDERLNGDFNTPLELWRLIIRRWWWWWWSDHIFSLAAAQPSKELWHLVWNGFSTKLFCYNHDDDDDDNDDDDDYRHPDHHALMMNVKMMMTMTIKQKRKAKKHESIRDPLKYQMVFIKWKQVSHGSIQQIREYLEIFPTRGVGSFQYQNHKYIRDR